MSQVSEFLDTTFNQNQDIKGVILIDKQTGLSLGVRGVARNSDSAFLSQYANSCSSAEPTVAEYLSWIVYLASHANALIAIYKDKSGTDLPSGSPDDTH